MTNMNHRRRQGQEQGQGQSFDRLEQDDSSIASLPPSGTLRSKVAAMSNAATMDAIKTVAIKSSASENSFSMFDPQHLESTQSPFRGIFYMCWLSMIAGVITTCFRHYRKYQCILGTNMYTLMSVYAYDFLIADGLMILSLFVPFFIQVLFVHSILPIQLSVFTRHAFQTGLIFTVVYYCTYCQTWSYIQTSVLLLHTIAMYMKVHSYSATNEKLHLAHTCKDPEQKKAMQQHLAEDKCIQYEGELAYPHNVTLANYIRYLAIPSLVYELNYIKAPR